MNETIIRPASPEDAGKILDIYAPYVQKTAITFEYEVPEIEEFRNRIRNTRKKYPYLVAQSGEEIVGYAYTGAFKSRAAYNWAVETTIYLKEDRRKEGLGRKLYEALEKVSQFQNITNLNACIAYCESDDAYLTKNSVQFHRHLGFELAGRFHKCGYKFGTWYDMVWMEKIIAPHPAVPSPFVPFPELSADSLSKSGIYVKRNAGKFY